MNFRMKWARKKGRMKRKKEKTDWNKEDRSRWSHWTFHFASFANCLLAINVNCVEYTPNSNVFCVMAIPQLILKSHKNSHWSHKLHSNARGECWCQSSDFSPSLLSVLYWILPISKLDVTTLHSFSFSFWNWAISHLTPVQDACYCSQVQDGEEINQGSDKGTAFFFYSLHILFVFFR